MLQRAIGDFIQGHFLEPAHSDGEIVAASPADTRDVLATYPFAVAQVDLAIDAARAAFPAFRRLGEPARRALLLAYQARLREHREPIANTLSREVGKPLWEARLEVDSMIGKVDLALGEGAQLTATTRIDALPAEVRHAPLGVIAVIGPFNFPGHLPNGQIVPALLTGNTVVHKPSERTPCTATWIARCMHEAGMPAGAFNVVQGDARVGARLTQHAGIDGILFTGSGAVGRAIIADNAHRPDRLIALELGGKNASIALDDCDLERTARAVAYSAFVTAGQRCTATSRLVVTRAIAEPLIARIAEIARGLRVGYVLDDDVFMGPVISEGARDNLLAAQAHAIAAGFQPVVSGGALEVAGHPGFYVTPAIARAPSSDLEAPGYSDHELFGPDLAIYVARDESEALEVAGRTRYGLTASVFTASSEAFERAVDALRVGLISWNRPTAGASGRLPFGGAKESGNHRPAGILMGQSCTQPMSVLLAPKPASGGPEPLPTWPGMGLNG